MLAAACGEFAARAAPASAGSLGVVRAHRAGRPPSVATSARRAPAWRRVSAKRVLQLGWCACWPSACLAGRRLPARGFATIPAAACGVEVVRAAPAPARDPGRIACATRGTCRQLLLPPRGAPASRRVSANAGFWLGWCVCWPHARPGRTTCLAWPRDADLLAGLPPPRAAACGEDAARASLPLQRVRGCRACAPSRTVGGPCCQRATRFYSTRSLPAGSGSLTPAAVDGASTGRGVGSRVRLHVPARRCSWSASGPALLLGPWILRHGAACRRSVSFRRWSLHHAGTLMAPGCRATWPRGGA